MNPLVKDGAALGPLPARPMVTVIVPSFNQGKFIGRTLDSIVAQSYRPMEILVMDGASTDETVEILRAYSARHLEIQWVSEKDDGVASAVNKGLDRAKGDIIGVQSSDDMYYAGAIKAAVDALTRHPQCGLIYGDSDAIDVEDHYLAHYRVPEADWMALFGISFCLPQQSIFMRRDVVDRVGHWNSAYYGCDLDYWLRMMLAAPVARIPFTFSAWRMYPEQRTQPARYRDICDGYERMIMDNAQLRLAPWAVRRAARASCHLMRLRFPPIDDVWRLRWHALCALTLFPMFPVHSPSWIWRRLVPGYGLLIRIYRWMRPVRPVAPGPVVLPGSKSPQ
ncbi:MAG: glycosyltransferase family 2 protein [Nevskiales bacterium]